MKKSVLQPLILLCVFFILTSYSDGVSAETNEQTSSYYFIESSQRFNDFSHPTVAIALGGGGARALVNVGVLKALEEENIPIDFVTGTSMGAIVAVLYGSGLSIENIEKLVTDVDLTRLFNLNFPFIESLINTDELNHFLEEIAPTKELENFPIPTGLLSYDLMKGTKYIHTTGKISDAVQGPYAIPLCFSGKELGELFLIDAGVMELTPAGSAKALGADLVIATTAYDELPYKKYNKLVRTFMRMINLIKEDYSRMIVDKYSDMVIVHDVGDYSFMDFQLAEEFINLGYEETKKKIPVIKEMLKSKNIPLRNKMSREELDFGSMMKDFKYDRTILDCSIFTPLFYYGKDYSVFKQNLFKDTFFKPQYGFEWKKKNISTFFMTHGFKGDNLEAKLRLTKVTSNIDIIGQMRFESQRDNSYLTRLMYYDDNYTLGLGFSHINEQSFINLNNTYDYRWKNFYFKGESDVSLPLKDLNNFALYEFLTSHDFEYQLNDSIVINPKIIYSNTEVMAVPNIYRGFNHDENKSLQTSLDLTYTQYFPHSLEIIQIIQVSGIDYYSFIDLERISTKDKDQTNCSIGGGVNVDFKLLGLKSSSLGGYFYYDLTEKAPGVSLEVDFTF